jgi:hypothetical protein
VVWEKAGHVGHKKTRNNKVKRKVIRKLGEEVKRKLIRHLGEEVKSKSICHLGEEVKFKLIRHLGEEVRGISYCETLIDRSNIYG